MSAVDPQGEPRAERVLRFGEPEARVYSTRLEMGQAAAREVADRMRALLANQERVAMVFAAAPSQDEFLAALAVEPGLEWGRVIAFHLDEYVGLPSDAPQGFGNFLRARLFDLVRPGVVHYLDGGSADPGAECGRYTRLLSAQRLDIACIGIGENGHIAFNDPPVADFDDPALVKVVALDERSRLQQVHDGCFARIADVPTHALTMTIPAIVGATRVCCVVPAPAKAPAVRDALLGPLATACPASILRRHARATLYLDRDSARLVLEDTGAVEDPGGED